MDQTFQRLRGEAAICLPALPKAVQIDIQVRNTIISHSQICSYCKYEGEWTEALR